MKITTLTVSNKAQAVIFLAEMSGQISDGMWENARPWNHHKDWSGVRVEVGENVGRNFYAVKSNYNFANKDLLECVGERIIVKVKIALLFDLDPEDLESAPDSAEGFDDYEKWFADAEWWHKVRANVTRNMYEQAEQSDIYTMKDLKNDCKKLKQACRIRL